MRPPFEAPTGSIIEVVNNGGTYSSSRGYAQKLGCAFWKDSFVPPNGMRGRVLSYEYMKDAAKYLISFRTQVQDIPLISNGYASAGRTKEHTRLMKPDDCVDFVMAMSAVQIVEKADILPKELFDI